MSSLVAYFDESGTHRGAVAIGITCLIGRRPQWEELELLWASRLEEDGIKVFHAVDCANCRGEFADMIYWNDARKSLLVGDLCRIVADRDFSLVGLQIPGKSWQLAFPNGPSPFGLRQPPATPYELCFYACVQLAVQRAIDLYSGESIDLVFGIQNEYAAATIEIASNYKDNYPIYRDRINSINFGSPSENIPLQVTDMISFEFYRIQDMIYDPSLINIRPIFQALDGEIGRSADVRLATTRFLRSMFLQSVEIETLPLGGHILPLIDYKLLFDDCTKNNFMWVASINFS